jgi:hypothetical protein
MQEKTVAQALTDISKVFAIDIDATLSREVLQQVCLLSLEMCNVF